MKCNKYMIGAMALTVAMSGLTSCGDSFLEEDYSAQVTDGLLETSEGALAMAAGLYGNIRWHFGYEWAYGITMYGCDEFTNGADLTAEPWNTYDARLNPLDCTTANGAANNNCPPVSGLWDEMYFGISTANLVISKAGLIPDKDSRNKAEGEAYFLRGYNYYRLFCQYGGVVLQTKANTDGSVQLNFERASEEAVLSQIIADLDSAYNKLPEKKWRGNGTWTKWTAAHFLAKALLYRQSERSASWNSKYNKEKDLKDAIKYCKEVITACPLAPDYRSLYADWTGTDCPNEGLGEILMAAEHNASSSTKGRFGNRTYNYFSPQFSNFSNGYTQRGQYIGDMDFQRCRPTEYAYACFDNVNDSRMWKTFKTVYGYNNYVKNDAMHGVGCPDGKEPSLGDVGIMFILNKKSYDPNCGTYGRGAVSHTFVNPETDKWVPNVIPLYDGGNYVHRNFGVSGNPAQSNFFCGINKTADGSRTAEKGDATRDVIMARTGETYLVLAECIARMAQDHLGGCEYEDAFAVINELRERAEWKDGEDRGKYSDGTQAFASNSTASASLGKCKDANGNKITNADAFKYSYITKSSYWVSTGLNEAADNFKSSDLTISYPVLPAEDEEILAKIGATSEFDRVLNFIMNERTRELLGEWNRWDELTRTKLLVKRAKAFNPEAADGIKDYHMYRPIPQKFIDALQDENGNNLSADAKAKWQNPGY